MKKAFLLIALLSLTVASCQQQTTEKTVVITATPQVIVATPEPSVTPSPEPTRTPLPPTPVLTVPTWREVAKFIEHDHTNWNQWDGTVYGGSYVCAQFAIDVVDHAQAKGIRSGLVLVEWAGNYGGHAFVWIDTSDKGRMWVEPQSDYAYVRPIAKSTREVAEGVEFTYPARTILQDIRGYYWETYVADAIEISQDLTWICEGAPTFTCEVVRRPSFGG
jgi:hypothetical protein